MADFAIVDELIFPTHNEVAPVGDEDDASDLAEQTVSQLIKGVAQASNYAESGLTVPSTSVDLDIDVALGVAFITGERINVPGATTVTVSPSTTNHLFLKMNRDINGDVDDAEYEVNTTGTPPADSIKLATLVADGVGITSTVDARPLTAQAISESRMEIFTASGVFSVPNDVGTVTVVMLGAGSGGGGGGESATSSSSGNNAANGGVGGDTWLVNSGNNARGGVLGGGGEGGVTGTPGSGGAGGTAGANRVLSFSANKFIRGAEAGQAGSVGIFTPVNAGGGGGTATGAPFDKFNRNASHGAGGSGGVSDPGGNGIGTNLGMAGGGGEGGGTGAPVGSNGGGGGGGGSGQIGEYVEMQVAVTPGATVTVNVGVGGTGGAGGTGTAGVDGGAGGNGTDGLMMIFY